MKNLAFTLAAVCLLTLSATAAVEQQAPAVVWGSLAGLVGDWSGMGAGKPGEGMGDMSIRRDLDGRVLVSRSHSEYPAQGGRPALVHDQIMVIYPAPQGTNFQAITFDNEGHTIEYALKISGNVVEFLSAAAAAAPRFRLTYTLRSADTLDIRFEVAPPGKPDAFAKYVEGTVKRRPGK